MSEQTKQTSAFMPPVYLGDMRVYDIGATTLADCHKMGYFKKAPTKKYRNKKPDLLIISNDGEVILYLESKDDGVLTSQGHINAAYDQEFNAAKSVNSRIFALRDSNHTWWYNPLTGNAILSEDGAVLDAHLEPALHPVEDERLIKKILSSITDENDRLLTVEEQNPTDLARKVHQLLFTWKSVSPSTALYTFVEIFLFKYLSDLGILNGMYSFEFLMGLYDQGNSDLDVLVNYKNNARDKVIQLFPGNVEDDKVMSTTVVNGTVFHDDIGDAETFHGILKLFKEYETQHGKFVSISPDFKSQLFETFLKQEDDKKRMGQFFTPLKIVRNMTRMVDVRPGMRICDPACGVGKFLLEAVSTHIDELYHYDSATGTVASDVELVGYDKFSEDNGDKTIILAKANALIYFSRFLSDNPSEACARSLSEGVLNPSFMLKRDSLGTLERLEEGAYDLILANPPYLVSGSKDVREKANKHAVVILEDGTVYCGEKKYQWGGMGIEAMFIEWMVRSLKPGGRATVVVPDGLLRNEGNAGLRSQIARLCDIECVISLPVNSFFSTQKKTYVVSLRKRHMGIDGTYKKQETPVFAFVCSSIGETLDVYRFDDPDHDDLTHAVDCYNVYRRFVESGADWNTIEKYLDGLDDSIRKRLKIIGADDIVPNSWIVEDFWSTDEKIALGLRNSRNTLTPEKFGDLLKETVSIMTDFAEELECMG